MIHRQLKDISIIIPCLNEAACIETLYKELSQVLASYSYPYELLFVDDGSTDNTLEVLSIITQADNRVHWISLSRNFGHQKALKAGIDAAKGQIVITMDADMQHPPTVIPRMLELWQEGYDIINTVRMENHKCSPFKKLTSQWFYRLMNAWSEVHIVKGGADFRLLDDKVIRVLRECREESLFLRGMTAWVGFRQIQIPYEANVRYAGETKYSLKKNVFFCTMRDNLFQRPPFAVGSWLGRIFCLIERSRNTLCCLYCLFHRTSCFGMGISGNTDFCTWCDNLVNAGNYWRVLGKVVHAVQATTGVYYKGKIHERITV